MAMSDELWVFGYGSLIFDPEMEVAEARRATLHGFRRRFCMWSIHHRGSEDEPGLVLALEPHEGGTCEGMAFRAADPVPALQALRARELVSSAYHERTLTLRQADGGTLDAIGYVVDTAHRQYVPDLSLDQQAEIIARARGDRGPNHEYLMRTADGLREAGMADPDLDRLVARVQQVRDAA